MWDMRAERIVRTLETGKAVTSLEVQRDGSFLTSADGSEARAWRIVIGTLQPWHWEAVVL